MLTGDLEAFRLADILRLVAASGANGTLEVTRGALRGTFQIREGLVRDARLAEGDLGDAIDAAMEMLRPSGGSFDLGGNPEPDGPLAFGVDELIERVARREEEWRDAIDALGSLDAPIRLATSLPDREVTITAERWRLLALVDGERTARELSRFSEELPSSVAAGLADLARAGLVTADRAASPERIEAPRATRGKAPAEPPAEPPGEPPSEPAPAPPAQGTEDEVDPAQLLRELGSEVPASPLSRRRIPTREEQRMRLRR